MFAFTDSVIARVLAFLRAQHTPVWLVGGAVRDRLLGRPNYDLDVVAPDGGIRLARAIGNALDGAFFVLDQERDVGRAVLHDDTGRPLYVDVARLRAPNLVDDLAYRDFTANAIAVDLAAGGPEPRFIDPFDGRGDVARRVLRAVSEGAFAEDPLRMLRAVRQSAELGFTIEVATFNLIRRDASLLAGVAAERVRDELQRIVTAPGAWRHLRLLATLDLLRVALPEAAALAGLRQSPPHYLDAWDHTRSVVAHLEGIVATLWPDLGYARPAPLAGDPVLIAAPAWWEDVARVLAPYAGALRAHLGQALAAGRTRRDWLFWAALAHDWGKALTAGVGPDGRIHFIGHEHVGARLAGERITALAFAAAEAAYLDRVVDLHMRPGHLAHDYPPSRRALYHLYRDAATTAPDVALLALADKMATHAPAGAGVADDAEASPAAWGWERQLDVTARVVRDFFGLPEGDGGAFRVAPRPQPLLNGRQIMAEFGLPPGPLVGALIEALREAQAVGEVSSADEARAWLAEHREALAQNPPAANPNRRF